MPTTKIYRVNKVVIASSQWSERDGGSAPQWIFTEGTWVFQWDGEWFANPPGTISATITVGGGSVYDYSAAGGSGTPPPIVSSSTVQALIDAGATITSIGASVSGNAPGDGRVTYTPNPQPTTLTELLNWEAVLTVTGAGSFPELVLGTSSGQINLSVPDTNNVEIEGSGGIILNRGTDDNGFGTGVTIVGDGGLNLNRGSDENGMSTATAFVGSGGLILNRGSASNGLTGIHCRDGWGPSGPGDLPYVPLQ